MHRRALLITPEYTLLASGRPGETPDIAGTPEGSLSAGPAALAERVAKLFKGHGVVLLRQDAADMLGLDAGWATYGTTPKVYIGRLDRIAPGEPLHFPNYLMDTVTTFALFDGLLGAPFHRSAGVAGLTLLTSLYPKGKTKRVDWESGGPADAYELAYNPRDWRGDQPGAYRHSYDKRRSGLGTLNVLEVARTALVHRPDQKTFDSADAGWWYCSVPAWNDARMPNPAGYGEGSTRWLSAPTIKLLNELADQGRSEGVRYIHGAWTAPKSRLFVGWAELVEAAYQKADKMAKSTDPDGTPSALGQDAERVREGIKAVYREMPGMFAAADSWVQRPDWYAAKVALERANAWRAADQVGRMTGRWPVAVDGDKWTYASDERSAELSAPTWTATDGAVRGLVIGDRLGQWRVQESGKR